MGNGSGRDYMPPSRGPMPPVPIGAGGGGGANNSYRNGGFNNGSEYDTMFSRRGGAGGGASNGAGAGRNGGAGGGSDGMGRFRYYSQLSTFKINSNDFPLSFPAITKTSAGTPSMIEDPSATLST